MNITKFIVFNKETNSKWGSSVNLEHFCKICKFLKQNTKGVNTFTVAWFDEKEIHEQNFIDFCETHKI